MPDTVTIVEVGPRDGLQAEKNFVPTATKIDLIHRLNETGLSVIEATSFVSPKWIPQLQDGAELLAKLNRKPSVRYPVLVPNVEGFHAAIQANATELAVFCSATEAFSHSNINCSIQESLARAKDIIDLAKQKAIPVRGYVSCVLGCPYEGKVLPEAVIKVAQALYQFGCYEVSLGDTIGVGTPEAAKILIKAVSHVIPLSALALHAHDTYNQALANYYAALEMGIRVFDSSVGGLGGCPYAKGATGNVATEDVVYMMHGLGLHTGIDLDKLVDVGQFISDVIGRPNRAKSGVAILAKRKA